MLELRNIKKDYHVGDETVQALKGINIKFRQSEFVSILGPSGCGKTTMLNIIGGLDRYTSGDLLINGISTKEYKDSDWDTYRNHSIGFIFQNYNLIPHQTVVENVELALTLSGVSKTERRKRAIEVLEKVGLKDKIKNKPTQLSGGQMQRVAIARALINDPDILLADEPTGALDSKTSEQIMEILKSISKDKLIIMVTHNPELAEQYSNRIIRLVDGEVVDDTNPFNEKEEKKVEKPIKAKVNKGKKNTSMSFMTALALSFKNLLTKKARTIMVAFAGSIGIIGIALILSVSNGFQNYIDKVQEDTLSTYPITLEANTMDYGSLMTELQGTEVEKVEPQDGVITSNDSLSQMLKTMQKLMTQAIKKNNLGKFKEYVETTNDIKQHSSAIQYIYDIEFNIYNNKYEQVNPNEVFKVVLGEEQYEQFEGNPMMSMSGFNVWSEMLDNMDLIKTQYDLLDGNWPINETDIVVVVDENNQISDYVLYSLGLKDVTELEGAFDKINNGEPIETTPVSFTYEDILGLKYKLVLPNQMYKKQGNIWVEKNAEGEDFKTLIDEGIELNVVGILRPKDSASATSISGAIAYTAALTDLYIDAGLESDIVQEQMANPEINIFTGLPYEKEDVTKESILSYLDAQFAAGLIEDSQYIMYKGMISNMDEDSEQFKAIVQMFLDSKETYESNMKKIGYIDKSNPTKINIYAIDFESKDQITSLINAYNDTEEAAGREDNVILYTDYMGLLLNSITTILDVITYVLIAFVAISLVVSSIMIGVITYISVLERTKEIGILRSIGARKRDISRVFTAETVVIGFAAGAIGILITLVLTVPINLIINAIAGFTINAAKLPLLGGLILIGVSMLLTVIAGLIPSRFAANRDPVEALRTE